MLGPLLLRLSKITVFQGDTAQFSEYLEKNMKLYSLRNGVDLRTESVAHWARKELATALRKGPYQVYVEGADDLLRWRWLKLSYR